MSWDSFLAKYAQQYVKWNEDDAYRFEAITPEQAERRIAQNKFGKQVVQLKVKIKKPDGSVSELTAEVSIPMIARLVKGNFLDDAGDGYGRVVRFVKVKSGKGYVWSPK